MKHSKLRTVLITGCSTGIGRASAVLLAERGYQVYAGVRSERHASELNSLGLALLKPVILNVTSEEDVVRVADCLREASPQGLFALINNAGIGMPSAVELSSPEEVRELFEVNTIAPLRLIQILMPQLRLARGRIVNVSSLNGILSLPMVGAYSASKFALEALTDALRIELRPWRISVSTIRPGQVRTPIFSKAGAAIDKSRERIPDELRTGYNKLYDRAAKLNDRGVNSSTDPERVAKVVLKALNSSWPRPHYLVGFDARGLNLLMRILPTRLLDRILARVMGVLKPVE